MQLGAILVPGKTIDQGKRGFTVNQVMLCLWMQDITYVILKLQRKAEFAAKLPKEIYQFIIVSSKRGSKRMVGSMHGAVFSRGNSKTLFFTHKSINVGIL